MAKHNPIKFGTIRLSKLSNKCENEPSLEKMNTNIFRFDKFFEPVAVVVVSHTRKNYFNWALSDWAIKANVWVLTFAPPPPLYIRHTRCVNTIICTSCYTRNWPEWSCCFQAQINFAFLSVITFHSVFPETQWLSHTYVITHSAIKHNPITPHSTESC